MGVVVVDVVDPHVAESIDLASHPHPGVDEIVVARGAIAAHGRAGSIGELGHREFVAAGAVGRSLRARGHAQGIGLAGFDQPGCGQDLGGGEVVDGAESVFGAKGGGQIDRVRLVRGRGRRRRKGKREEDSQQGGEEPRHGFAPGYANREKGV